MSWKCMELMDEVEESPIFENGPSSENCDEMIIASSSVLDDIMLELVDDVVLGLCFEVHRAHRLGTLFLDETDEESQAQFRIVDMKGVDVFGQVPMKKQYECVCPNCQRNLAASRFAPHLEKCMGMGRNSSRLASRRLADASKKENSVTENNSGGEENSNDNENDHDWTYGGEMKKTKRVKKGEKGSIVSSGSIGGSLRKKSKNRSLPTSREQNKGSVASQQHQQYFATSSSDHFGLSQFAARPPSSASESSWTTTGGNSPYDPMAETSYVETASSKSCLIPPSQNCGGHHASENTNRMCTRSARCQQYATDGLFSLVSTSNRTHAASASCSSSANVASASSADLRELLEVEAEAMEDMEDSASQQSLRSSGGLASSLQQWESSRASNNSSPAESTSTCGSSGSRRRRRPKTGAGGGKAGGNMDALTSAPLDQL